MSLIKSTVVAATLIGALFSTTAHAEPVYLVAQVEVTDFDQFFGTYGQTVLPMLMGRNVEILAGGGGHKTLEGDWDYNHTVILKFESEEEAMDFYDSPEYVDARELRLANSTANNLILVNHFAMPSQ